MNGLTIVAVIVVLLAQSFRIWKLQRQLDETRNLTADTLDAHTSVLMRFQGRLSAVEYPKYLGTPIDAESECETPEDVHFQRPRRGQESAMQEVGFYAAHDAAVAEALKHPLSATLPHPETSPFFTESRPE